MEEWNQPRRKVVTDDYNSAGSFTLSELVEFYEGTDFNTVKIVSGSCYDPVETWVEMPETDSDYEERCKMDKAVFLATQKVKREELRQGQLALALAALEIAQNRVRDLEES